MLARMLTFFFNCDEKVFSRNSGERRVGSNSYWLLVTLETVYISLLWTKVKDLRSMLGNF